MAQPEADVRPWDVWCQGHIDLMGDRAQPRYSATTWNEAQKLLAQAKRECQAEPRCEHFIKRAGTGHD